MKLALRLPKINRNLLMLSGAIVLGVVALALSHKLLKDRLEQVDAEARGRHRMVSVVVAKQDLPLGFAVQPRAFAVRQIPAEYVQASSIDPQHFSQFLGRKLIAPVHGGEALLEMHMESMTQVFSATLEDGNRALTTEVDEVNSISGLLRPTDHIDLMVTAHGSGTNTGEVTFSLLTNVEVLATGQVTRKGQGSDQSRTYTTITLSVSPVDAQRIVVAKNSGRLTAVLRNPEDAKANNVPAMRIDDLLPRKQGPVVKSLAVQYIIGGNS
jgi:pilus assembly protein CpaB